MDRKCSHPFPCYPLSRFVKGEGPLSTRVMLVGEAPGREEDIQGRPFVGGAGRTLNYLLTTAGISRGEVYITNVVKCRPPNNRTPTPEEVQKCLPLLEEEIRQIMPTHIVALGEVAATALTGKDLSWRGMIVPWAKDARVSVLITYHPAYIMRDRSAASVFLHDLDKLKSPPPVYPRNYILNPNEGVLKLYLERWRDCPVAVDVETAGGNREGLDPLTASLIGIAFCGEPGVAVHLSHKHLEQCWETVKAFLEGPTPKVFQNNLFDRAVLKAKGVTVRNVAWDTQEAMYLLYSDSEKSLDFLRSLYTSIPPYKKAYKKRAGGIARLEEGDLGTYNCLDVDVTQQVFQAQQKYFSSSTLRRLKEYLLELDEVALEMRLRGVYVSRTNLAKHYLRLKPVVEELEERFYKEYGVNLASPLQVSALLFDTLKLPPPSNAYKGTKTYSVEEEVLRSLLETVYSPKERKVVEEVLLYRERSKALQTYIVGLYALIGEDGRLHPDWRPTGTDTGRWACKHPNMQNIPEDLRDIVCAPEGKVLLVADYKQLELLTVALLAEQYDLVEAVLKGKDVHEEVRQEMSKVAPATRLQAKAVVFGTAYGLTARSLAMRFRVPVALAEKWQQIAIGRFPKINAFKERNIRFWERHGYVESWFGRRKYCERPTQALNHPVQSTAADITLCALLKLQREGFHPIFTVHDENGCEEENAYRAKEFTEIVTNPVPELHHYFPVDFRVTTTWKEVKE